MKKFTLLSLTLVAGLSVTGIFVGKAFSGGPRPTGTAAAAPAAAAAAPSSAPVVAAIDVTRVLKDHRGFKTAMEQLKAQVVAAEQSLNAQREAIAKKEESMKSPTFKPGSPEFKKLEEDIITQKSSFNTLATLQRKNLMEKETQIYAQVYTEISTEVKKFAEYYKLQMVLRHTSETPVDDKDKNTLPGSDRSEVARNLSKPIIYLRGDLDITGQILESINSRYPAPPVANRPGAAQPK